jgi:hypothetical protein
MSFFTEVEKSLLKFISKYKSPPNSQNNPEQEE